jgi:hypothetical protein
LVCGTIASGDDYDDIVDWGKAHLSFPRGFAEFHFGIPCAGWLRCIMNRIDPGLFRDCFVAWVAECWPDKLDLVAMRFPSGRLLSGRRSYPGAPRFPQLTTIAIVESRIERGGTIKPNGDSISRRAHALQLFVSGHTPVGNGAHTLHADRQSGAVMRAASSRTFAFEPEHIEAMRSAFEAVCAKLRCRPEWKTK